MDEDTSGNYGDPAAVTMETDPSVCPVHGVECADAESAGPAEEPRTPQVNTLLSVIVPPLLFQPRLKLTFFTFETTCHIYSNWSTLSNLSSVDQLNIYLYAMNYCFNIAFPLFTHSNLVNVNKNIGIFIFLNKAPAQNLAFPTGTQFE